MIFKQPFCIDVSHYKEIPDFKSINPRPVLFITKATEAHPGAPYSHTDEKFIRFFEGAQEIGATRGAYHFNRKSANPYKQAEHFINTISKLDILPTDILILDVEEGGEKAAQLWAWFETVRQAFPNNARMLYSRKNILDPIYMTTGEKEYFKKIPTWPAGYPYFPDLFLSIPKGYIPDQTKYGEPWLWQYNETAIVTGIKGEVDLNWISPTLYSIIGDTTIGESTMANFAGEVVSSDPAKVWKTIGGTRIYPDLVKDTKITADMEQTVSGVKYIHLTSPVVGWSKAIWFSYSETTPPPPPPPPPPPQPEEVITHKIDIYSSGKISIDGGLPY